MGIRIRSEGNGITQEFASQELAKYLTRMMPGLEIYEGGQEPGKTIRLGLFEDFGLDASGLEDRRYDDAFAVDIDGLDGFIAGSNDRSILFGIYRFLEQAGCHWARHGADGEYIPGKDISALAVKLEDRAAYRHRGMCIEGADSLEIMLDNIDWVLKAGFNTYFLQFFIPYTFFERYYSHTNSTCKTAEPVSIETVESWKRQLEQEIKRRGLLYHAVGHAWTCGSLGLEGLEWKPAEYDLGDDKKELLALVNGKREVWEGIPLNTNLCYSNPTARANVVKTVVDYLSGNACVDFLQIWLADAANNNCECPGCQAALPSDFYVMLLNEIDAELTRLGIRTRIVFLAYVDLLWAPQKEKFNNPDRFLFLFAPITRSYSSTYDYATEGIQLPAYERNHLTFPKTAAENIAHIARWREMYHGDGLAFEYYFMWDHFLDPGYYGMANVMSQDIKNLRNINLNGLISCQCQRAFFPTGFPMYVMGKTLWDDTASLEDLAQVYFARTFGPDGEKCRQYLSEISNLFDQVYLRGEKVSRADRCDGAALPVDPNIPARLGKIPAAVAAFTPVIKNNIEKCDGSMRSSWKYLVYHGEIITALSQALLELETGSKEKAREIWIGIVEMVSRYEDDTGSVLDLFEFVSVWGRRFE
jgi:hypothetical protein